MENIRTRHQQLDLLIGDINQKAANFNDKVIFFIPFPKDVSFNSFEVCFKDSVSWLYKVLHEAAGLNLKFVDGKIRDFGIQIERQASGALSLVHALRTVRQHLMDALKPDDLAKLSFCEEWFVNNIGKSVPSTEEDWHQCLEVLLDNTSAYLGTVDRCIDQFPINEFPDIIIEDWDRLVNRSYSKHDWETVLIAVLEDYGMAHYDTLAIVTKQLDKWRDKLKLLKDGFEFTIEAKRIIGNYLAQEDLWPATANDLIALGVPKGPKLGEMVKKAKALYYESPCPKEEFLRRFDETYLQPKTGN